MSGAAQKVRPKAALAAPELRRAPTPERAVLSGSPRYLRASLRVGGVNDPEERQAEHAASVVASGGQYKVHDPGGSASLRAAVAPPVADPAADGRVRRAVAPPITDPGGVIRRAPSPMAGPSDAEAARRIDAARSAVAKPLPAPVKARLEHGFGHKMDGVRVHTGPAARAAAAAIGARAYTEGNRITLGHGESEHDLHLMAHEATHVVQNRAAVPQPPTARRSHAETGDIRRVDSGDIRRAEAEPVAASGPIRRFGIDTVLDFLADKANMIPGFRMFTIILGVNPVNMSSVDRSAANVLRAVVELMPGGALIVSALDKYGVFEKAGAWVSQQIDTLGLVGASIGQAVSKFIDSLHWRDALHPGDVWDRAKRIFTDPIDRIIAFIHTLVDGVIQFVKDAVLRPLAELASKTRAWDLLIALLGKNPITGDPVPQTAETLIGGFMKLIGQEEVWQNMQKSHAVARAFAWFKNAMATVVAFAMQLPGLFLAALKSFSISDLLDLPGAIGRVLGMFGDFAGRFIAWAADAVWKLLEIIFDVVSPAAWGYVKKTGAALKSILKNPLPFVHNLVHAGKLAFQNFADHIGTHLKTGLIDWLTGAMTGVYIPKAFSLIEMGKFALSVLGITWAQIRGKIVKALGPTGEKIMAGLEKTFDVVVALVTGGPAAAWEVIKENLTNLKDMVVDGVIGFVTDTIVKKAIPKIVSMFIPGAGFISAILSIYDTVMVFVQKLSKIIAAVTAFIDSIVSIAAGMVESAAQKVESTLASLLSLAISFLAGFLGLGNIAAKIKEVIEKVRAMVDKALDKAIGWIVGKAKSLFAKLFGGKDDKDATKDKKAEGPGDIQRPRIVVPFTLGAEGHELILDPKGGGATAVEMASGSPLPFEKKQRDAYNGIEYFKQYMSSITDEQVRREFETKLMPDITGFQSSNIDDWKNLYEAKFPKDKAKAPISDAEARSRAEYVKNQAEAMLGRLKAWGATSGIPDLAKSVVDDTLQKKGQEIWKAAWEARKQQVAAALAGITYKGVPLAYRGSLQKGYKGPHKNQVRFNPSDFDVDLYVVHPEDFKAAKERGAEQAAKQIFPGGAGAPAELQRVSRAARAALVAALPDVGGVADTSVTLRGQAP